MNERLEELSDWLDASADEVLTFLDSPAGRRLRRFLATGMILTIPLLLRLPGLRRSPLGKVLEVTGGATLVVKLAEMIRDWERELPDRRVIDVPRAG
jgi:hypothetical protein